MSLINFPVITFNSKQVFWEVIFEANDLGTCSKRALRSGYFDDMYIYDSSLKKYEVLGVGASKAKNNLFRWPYELMMYSSVLKKVDLKLSEGLPTEFDLVKKDVCQKVSENKSVWGDSQQVKELLDEIDSSGSFEQLINALTFE